MVGNVTRALEALLASAEPDLRQLDSETAEAIEEFIEKHLRDETMDNRRFQSSRLHEELVRIHKSSVSAHAESEALFVHALIELAPCLVNLQDIRVWFAHYASHAIDSAGHKNSMVSSSRELILKFLYGLTGEDEQLEAVYEANGRAAVAWVLDIYLEGKSDSLVLISDADSSLKSKERQRFIQQNARDLLIQYGFKVPRNFFAAISDKFNVSSNRLHLLSLISAYISYQPPHLFQVQRSPLLDQLFDCLLWDQSVTALSICGTAVAMVLPHICDGLVGRLPKLLAIYGRLASWHLQAARGEFDDDEDEDIDEYETHKSAETKEALPANDESNSELSKSTHSLDQPPTIEKPLAPATFTSGKFEILEGLTSIQDGRPPALGPLFTFLYGLFPSNLLAFIREPTKYLDEMHYIRPFTDYWDKHSIHSRSMALLEIHVLNPSLISLTSEQELTDKTRWIHLGSASDIAAFCVALCTNSRDGNLSRASISAPTSERVSTATSAPVVSSTAPQFRSPFGDAIQGGEKDNGDPLGPNEHRLSIAQDRSLSVASDSFGTSDSTARQSMLFSPALHSIDTLIQEHERLYNRKDMLEKRDSVPAIPEELNLDDPHSTAPTTPVAPTSALRRSTVVGTGVRPPSSSAASPAVVAENVSSHLPSPSQATLGLSPRLVASAAPGDSMAHTEQFGMVIEFYQRELLLLRNEADFVGFIERHSQYRMRKLREQLSEATIAHARIDRLLHQNKQLKAQLEKPELEVAKYQKSLRTYKSERQAYEASLVQKNKDLRSQISQLKQELEESKGQLELVDGEKAQLGKELLERESELSKLELRLTEARERLEVMETHEALLKKTQQQLEDLDRDYRQVVGESPNLQGVDDSAETTDAEEGTRKIAKPPSPEVEELLIKLEDLRMAYESIEADKKQMEVNHAEQLRSMQEQLHEQEDQRDGWTLSGSKNAQNGGNRAESARQLMESFKAAAEDRYSELKTSYDELVQRYADLTAKVRDIAVTEEERQARIEQSILSKRMMLGYDGSPEQHEMYPRPLSPTIGRPEARMRGRGGVQNTVGGSGPGQGGPGQKPPRRPFRGYG